MGIWLKIFGLDYNVVEIFENKRIIYLYYIYIIIIIIIITHTIYIILLHAMIMSGFWSVISEDELQGILSGTGNHGW